MPPTKSSKVKGEQTKAKAEAKKYFRHLRRGSSFLQYHLAADNLEIVHTYVPVDLRGKGIAALLTSRAFDKAEKLSLPVRPTCTYVRDTFLVKNNKYLSQIEQGGK